MAWLTACRSRRNANPDSGAAAVEFALVSLLLLPILLGIISFGLFFWGYQAAEHAAREGARLAAVGVPCDEWEAAVFRRAGRIIDPDEFEDTGASYTVSDDGGAGDEIIVTVRYAIPGSPAWLIRAATAILPTGSTIVISDGTGDTALQTTAIARNEASSNEGCS